MAPISQSLALLTFATMASVPHEFVTVDMRGLKAALIERSLADRVSASSLVRDFVAAGLGQANHETSVRATAVPSTPRARLSIRMSAQEARRFVEGARLAGLSLAAYLAELMQPEREITPRAIRIEQVSALIASNGEMSALGRNLRHLANLLRAGSTQSAQEYRGMLATLDQDVRRHLKLAAQQLADMGGSRRRYVDGQRSDKHDQSE